MKEKSQEMVKNVKKRNWRVKEKLRKLQKKKKSSDENQRMKNRLKN